MVQLVVALEDAVKVIDVPLDLRAQLAQVLRVARELLVGVAVDMRFDRAVLGEVWAVLHSVWMSPVRKRQAWYISSQRVSLVV